MGNSDNSTSFIQLIKNWFYDRVQGHAEEYMFHKLYQRGYNPSTIIDVGAYEGEWSKSMHSIFPDARFILIEPLPEKKSSLEHLDIGTKTVYNDLLSDETGETKRFYEMETGSSYYPEQTDADRKVTERSTVTLDDLVAKEEISNALLKIDAQGAELDIIKGSERALEDIHSIYLELSLVKYNQGAPPADKVISELNDRGYRITDVGTRHRRGGELVQIDVLFTDDSLSLDECWKEAV